MPEIYKASPRQSASANRGEQAGQKNENSQSFSLSSYNFHPNAHFENQDHEEKIILLLRRHPVTNIPWIVLVVALVVSPLLLTQFNLFSWVPSQFQLISALIWYLLATAIAMEGALSWYFNVNIVTDERILDVDFHNLIYKEVSDTKIDKIQDVTYKMGGVVRTVFNYGDVLIQTAGALPNFEFGAVPRPADVAKILQELRIEEEKEVIERRIR